MALKHVPGTLWKSHGAWHWRVTLPGERKRRDVILTFAFSGRRIPADMDEGTAEAAAWRLWESHAKKYRADGTPAFTVNDLCDRWIAHAAEYYRRADGSPTSEAVGAGQRVRPFREAYGSRPVEAMTHPDMLRYRDALIARGYARKTVNGYLSAARRMFVWALDEALVSAQVKAELTQVAPLKRGRSAARETEPVRAVPDDVVERTCRALPPSLADMVRVHRLTGMRPDEVCSLRWEDVERVGDVWAYRPSRHKNAWRNQPRVVAIGPRAQAILSRRLGDGTGFVFDPAATVAERYEAARAARKSALRTDEDARREAARRARGAAPAAYRECWDVCSYARAVRLACDAAGVPRWTPNQLRHSCATAVRRRFGLMAARAVLGHSFGMRVTDIYSFEAAEDDVLREATPAALALG